MQMGLDKSVREAAALWALDSALPDSVVEQIARRRTLRGSTR